VSAATTPGPPRDHTSPVRPSNWNIANALTLVRIALVPLFIALLLREHGESAGWRLAAVAAFAIAMATDRVDGELARRRQLITDLGKIADPIADKALVGAALIALSILGDLWWWVTILVMLREVLVTLLRFIVIRHGVMPASRGGKAKTVAQAIAIMMYVAPLPDQLVPVAVAAMVVAVALTLGTGVDYALQAVQLRRTSERTLRKTATAAHATGAASGTPSGPDGRPRPDSV
jgi:CDP-diacylglycerol--glycerol-3-phosphate 3-phosphatidyltransferase